MIVSSCMLLDSCLGSMFASSCVSFGLVLLMCRHRMWYGWKTNDSSDWLSHCIGPLGLYRAADAHLEQTIEKVRRLADLSFSFPGVLSNWGVLVVRQKPVDTCRFVLADMVFPTSNSLVTVAIIWSHRTPGVVSCF